MTARRAGRAVAIAAASLALAAALALAVGPSMGLFSGSRPGTLGFDAGRFAEGDWRPNWVSSTVSASDTRHHVAPIAFEGDPARAWEALEAAVRAMPRLTVVTRRAGYLHAEAASRGLGFVDDVEFALDEGARVIHVKSAARLGIRDFSVNRERVEAIRTALARARA